MQSLCKGSCKPAKLFVSGTKTETVDCRAYDVDTGIAVGEIYEIVSAYMGFYDVVDDIIELFIIEQIDFSATCNRKLVAKCEYFSSCFLPIIASLIAAAIVGVRLRNNGLFQQAFF